MEGLRLGLQMYKHFKLCVLSKVTQTQALILWPLPKTMIGIEFLCLLTFQSVTVT
jgi:hypothetical protein